MTNCIFGKSGTCQLLNKPIVAKCKCPLSRTDELEKCTLCGNQLLDFVIWYNDAKSEPHILCQECANKQNTCATCAVAADCRFQTDPSPIPQVILQTQRQGNMVMQVQVRNPERIATTCALCDCWDGEVCNREYQTCGKYKSIIK